MARENCLRECNAIEIFRRNAAAGIGSARRQIVITASIAGYAPLSTCPSYAATKAAMKSWGLSLRGMLKREGIGVSVICPGFIRSRITDRNTCPMPFFMEADKAAKIILKRAERNVGLIAFPWPMRLATWFLSTLPYRVNELINSILPEKDVDAFHPVNVGKIIINGGKEDKKEVGFVRRCITTEKEVWIAEDRGSRLLIINKATQEAEWLQLQNSVKIVDICVWKKEIFLYLVAYRNKQLYSSSCGMAMFYLVQ